jgi:replicative DNA helicase
MRKKVIHYTLELSADDVAERYDASFAKIPIRDLLDREADLARTMEKLGQRMGNSLIIKEYPTKSASVSTIRSHIQQCLAVGFVPDMIIVDYLDLLKSDFRRKEKREELSDIAEALRGLAGEIGIPCWSATQSRRGAISKEIHDEEDVSEDIGKMNISDLVITINQTKEQYGDGIMKLLVAKNRNGPRWETVEIVTSLSRMCFFNPPKGDENKTGNAGKNTANATKTKSPPTAKPKSAPKKAPPLRRPAVM